MLNRFSVLSLLTLVAGCASSPPPAQAPGSNPEDMSATEHEAAAQAEEREAAEHRKIPVNPNTKSPQQADERRKHEEEAQKHENFAEQHRDSADKAADAGAK